MNIHLLFLYLECQVATIIQKACAKVIRARVFHRSECSLFLKIRICTDVGNSVLFVTNPNNLHQNLLIIAVMTFTENRYLLWLRHFLQMSKILLMESCCPLYLGRMRLLAFIIAMESSPRLSIAISSIG